MAILYFVKQTQQQQIGQNKKQQTRQKLTKFAPRMYVSLFLCLILVYLGPVEGISHRRSINSPEYPDKLGHL